MDDDELYAGSVIDDEAEEEDIDEEGEEKY